MTHDIEAFEKIVKNNDEEADLFFDVNRGGYRDAQMRYAFHWFKIFKEEASHAEHIAKQEPVYQVGVGYASLINWYDKQKQEYDEITIVEGVQKRVLYPSPQPAKQEPVGEAVYFLQTGALQYTEVEKMVYEMAKPEYRRLLHTSPQPANHTDNSAVQAKLDEVEASANSYAERYIHAINFASIDRAALERDFADKALNELSQEKGE